MPTLANRFVAVMNEHQFASRCPNQARTEAARIGGQWRCHMSFDFRDGSGAFLTDQAGWVVKLAPRQVSA